MSVKFAGLFSAVFALLLLASPVDAQETGTRWSAILQKIRTDQIAGLPNDIPPTASFAGGGCQSQLGLMPSESLYVETCSADKPDAGTIIRYRIFDLSAGQVVLLFVGISTETEEGKYSGCRVWVNEGFWKSDNGLPDTSYLQWQEDCDRESDKTTAKLLEQFQKRAERITGQP